MLVYHLYGVIYGETSVEAQDNEEYRRRAGRRSEVCLVPSITVIYLMNFVQEFVNSYDCGSVAINGP